MATDNMIIMTSTDSHPKQQITEIVDAVMSNEEDDHEASTPYIKTNNSETPPSQEVEMEKEIKDDHENSKPKSIVKLKHHHNMCLQDNKSQEKVEIWDNDALDPNKTCQNNIKMCFNRDVKVRLTRYIIKNSNVLIYIHIYKRIQNLITFWCNCHCFGV